jgi:formyl-CoA transferase
VTRTQSSEWWINRLEDAGIPCGPVNDIKDVFDDPQVKHLEMAMPMHHRKRGDINVVANPLNIEGLETGVYRDVPELGEHGAEILTEAGLSATEIADLRAKGALGGA